MTAARSTHELITASRVNKTPVFNPEGEKIGHVDDLSIDKVSGRVVYAILSFGGFLGFGESFQPLPWSALRYEPAQGGYVVSLAKQDLEKAPAFTAAELEHFGAGRQQSVNDYWDPFPVV